ncbi:hypothetical protein C8Q79DRAFT_157276 [Trametes meyenii]|nr:hypothetical protein C8Q79DRAFT_157276 [Trametes meyenii]
MRPGEKNGTPPTPFFVPSSLDASLARTAAAITVPTQVPLSRHICCPRPQRPSYVLISAHWSSPLYDSVRTRGGLRHGSAGRAVGRDDVRLSPQHDPARTSHGAIPDPGARSHVLSPPTASSGSLHAAQCSHELSSFFEVSPRAYGRHGGKHRHCIAPLTFRPWTADDSGPAIFKRCSENTDDMVRTPSATDSPIRLGEYYGPGESIGAYIVVSVPDTAPPKDQRALPARNLDTPSHQRDI